MIVRLANKKGVTIKKITGDNGEISKEIENNTAGIGAETILNETGFDSGLEIEIHKKMGVGTGLGSSAASAVAATVACNALLETKFDKNNY